VRTLAVRSNEFNPFFFRQFSLNSQLLTATFLKTEGPGLLAEVDLGIYHESALMKVAYRFTDRCYVHLQHRREKIVTVHFEPKSDQQRLGDLAGEFCNELLDQSLREIIGRESEPIRNLVLAHALSRGHLTSSEPPQDDRRP